MRFEMRRIPCLVFWNTMRGRVLGLFAWLFGTVLVCWRIKGRAAWCAAINPGILHLTYSAALSQTQERGNGIGLETAFLSPFEINTQSYDSPKSVWACL